MSFECWQETVYGVSTDDIDITSLNESQCRAYWETYASPDMKVAHNADFNDDPVGFINDFSDDEGSFGPFALIATCLAKNPTTKSLGIRATTDEHDTCVLGVPEVHIFPWEAKQLSEKAEAENITFDRATETILTHVTKLFGTCPPPDDHTLDFCA